MDNLIYIKTKSTQASVQSVGMNKRDFFIHSETIAKDVIERLISYTVTVSYQNDIEKKVPEKCWSYMKKILDDFIHLEYISHERDDFNIDNLNVEKKLSVFDENITNQKLFKHFNRMDSEIPRIFKFEKDNFAVLNEFDTLENIDNGDNNLMDFGIAKRHDLFESSRSLFFDNKFESANFWSSIKEPVICKIDRAAASCVKVTKFSLAKDNPIDEKLEQNQNDTKSNFSRTFQKKTTMTFYNNNNNSVMKTTKKSANNPEIIDRSIDSFRLSSEEEEINIQELRRVKNEEMKKKEEEIKIKEKVEKAIKEKAIETVKKQKEYERKNATTDADGKVIFIKNEPAEKFTNDFVNLRCEIRDKGETINYLSPSVKTERIEIYPSAQNLNLFLKKEDKPQDKSTPKRENLKSTTKLKSDTSFHLTSSVNDKYYDRGPIIPGGSSYDQIIPEVGVTFYEAGKSKFGGTDYFKAYKKYSHNDYLSILKHTQHTLPTFKEHSETSKVNRTNTKTNNVDFTLTLPYVNRETIIEKNNQNKTQFGFTTGSLKVSKNYTNFLKSANVDLDSIVEKDEYPFNLKKEDYPREIIDNSNLFKKTGNNYNKKEQDNNIKNNLEEINNFNMSIVKNNQWGTFYSKISKDDPHKKKLIKPDLKEIEREVGKNILNTKLPRSRVFSYVKPPSQMSSMFNKTSKKNKVEAGES